MIHQNWYFALFILNKLKYLVLPDSKSGEWATLSYFQNTDELLLFGIFSNYQFGTPPPTKNFVAPPILRTLSKPNKICGEVGIEYRPVGNSAGEVRWGGQWYHRIHRWWSLILLIVVIVWSDLNDLISVQCSVTVCRVLSMILCIMVMAG